jgi:predicted porin
MKQHNFLILGGALLSGVCGTVAAQSTTATLSSASNVSMYGIVDVALTRVDHLPGGTKTYMRSGPKDGNRLGFQGSEDLGGGTRAIFKLEAGLNTDDGTAGQGGSLFNRAAFIGLTNTKLGTLTMGRQYSSYFDALNALGPVPVVTGSAGDHPGDIDGFDITIRHNNSIKYTSPALHGVTGSVMVASGEQAGHTGSGGSAAASVKFDGSQWHHAIGYQLLKNGVSQLNWDSNTSSSFSKSPVNAGYLSARDVQFLAAGTRYQMGAVSLGGSVSNVQYTPNATSVFRDKAIFNTGALLAQWQTSTPWLLGAGYTYTQANTANGITDGARYRQFALQQAYWFTKRTSVYLLEAVQRASGQTLAANGKTIIGADAVIGTSQGGLVGDGGHQTMFSLGLRHSF